MSDLLTKETSEVEIPRYTVRERCFIEPYLLHPGSVIETFGDPGPHLVPMNTSAEEAMEKWYVQEVQEKDMDGKLVKNADGSPHMIRPHEQWRFLAPKSGPTGEPVGVTIISGPPKVNVGVENTLAGKHLQRKLGEMRPPPAPFSEVQVVGDTGAVTIAHAAPRPKVR